MRINCCVVALLLGALTPGAAWSAHDVTVGIKGGLNLANLTGEDVFHNSSSAGFVGGVFARYGLSDKWSLEPEAMFTMRGAEFSVGDIETEQQTNYIEIPVLARIAWGGDARFRPSLFAGPSVGFLLKNRIVDGAEIDLKDGSNDVDAGGIIGTALDYALGAGVLVLDARYEMGLVSWSPDLGARNSTLSFTLGYGFPLASGALGGPETEGSR